MEYYKFLSFMSHELWAQQYGVLLSKFKKEGPRIAKEIPNKNNAVGATKYIVSSYIEKTWQ